MFPCISCLVFCQDALGLDELCACLSMLVCSISVEPKNLPVSGPNLYCSVSSLSSIMFQNTWRLIYSCHGFATTFFGDPPSFFHLGPKKQAKKTSSENQTPIGLQSCLGAKQGIWHRLWSGWPCGCDVFKVSVIYTFQVNDNALVEHTPGNPPFANNKRNPFIACW